MQLPNGFTAIKDATIVGDVVNLMGVLVSYNGPRPSKGTDHVLDFTIQDDFTSGSVGSQSSISGRIFKPFYKFPKISGPGDVVIVRKVKLNQWMTRMECLGDRYETTITVFPSCMIPVPELSHAYQAGSQKLPCDSTPMTQTPTVAEQMAVIRLKHASSGSNQLVQQHAATAAAKSRTTRRETLIKDLQFDVFANVRAQVVNVYHYPMGGQVDLKVTDYTPNENMFFYADPEIEEGLVSDRSWKGPYGYLTLSVTLYEENANWARENVATGDYVYIRNMRPKMSTRNTLEGVVHQDRVNASQVDIRHLKNESDIAEINKRRQEYERKRGGKTALARLENEPKRPSAKAAHNKRLAKRERQRAEKEAEIEELQKKAEAWEAERTGINPNVRSAHGDMRLCAVWEIKNNRHLTMRTPIQYNEYVLPFVNCRYRTRVRVVDVFPPKLELFAHSLNDPNWTKHPKKRTFDSTSSKERWEWGFVLLLEDIYVAPGRVPEKIRVLVNNSSAQYLLKMGAQDLKKNPKALKQLERKLFILWGNLMELKTELRAQGSDLPLPPGDNRLQNKPFEACIEEYGCEVPVTFFDMFGYRRMHKLALTTINMD